MHGQSITNFIIDQEDLTFNELLHGKKKAKEKSRGAYVHGNRDLHMTGRKMLFEARHLDGKPLSLTMQAALKNGDESLKRMVVLIKPTSNNIKGDDEVGWWDLNSLDLNLPALT